MDKNKTLKDEKYTKSPTAVKKSSLNLS